ncbi:alpha/beta hydrolase fold domain-containing protein [Streptomyces sp. NPDC047043]|uniref:alpha/beta hydrolase fold domain-containing protein n=1 Tax=Streptomyces sp. NPDC047043 TaxID=3154497 RepID=UPI003401520C
MFTRESVDGIVPQRGHPSLRMRFVCACLAATRTKRVLGDAESTEADRLRVRRKGPAAVPRRVLRRYDVSVSHHSGLRCTEIGVRGRRPDRTIVYLHGGAYVYPAVVQHWDLMAALAAENNARVIAPCYPLAPEGTAATVIPSLLDLQVRLTERSGAAPVWAGDSAGGGLALATAMRLRDEGLPPPRHLVLIAPWLDIGLSNPGVADVIDRDPTLDVAGLRYAGRLWAGALPPDSPQVSPGGGDLRGLPPTTVIVGTRDIFVADCRDFTARARAAGVDATLLECAGGFHAYPAVTFLPESIEARRLVTTRLNAADPKE